MDWPYSATGVGQYPPPPRYDDRSLYLSQPPQYNYGLYPPPPPLSNTVVYPPPIHQSNGVIYPPPSADEHHNFGLYPPPPHHHHHRQPEYNNNVGLYPPPPPMQSNMGSLYPPHPPSAPLHEYHNAGDGAYPPPSQPSTYYQPPPPLDQTPLGYPPQHVHQYDLAPPQRSAPPSPVPPLGYPQPLMHVPSAPQKPRLGKKPNKDNDSDDDSGVDNGSDEYCSDDEKKKNKKKNGKIRRSEDHDSEDISDHVDALAAEYVRCMIAEDTRRFTLSLWDSEPKNRYRD